MVSFTRMQSAGQGRSYLSKENYHLKESEIGHIYSLNPALLKSLGVEYGQKINADIHTAILDGYKFNDEYLEMIQQKELINIIGKELEKDTKKIENLENRIEYLTTLLQPNNFTPAEITKCKQDILKLEKSKSELEKNLEDLNLELKKIKSNIDEKNIEKKSLNTKLYRATQEIEDIKEYMINNELSEDDIKKLNLEIVKNEEIIRQSEKEINVLEKILDKELATKTSLENEIMELEKDIKNINQKISIEQAKIKSAELTPAEQKKYEKELATKTKNLENIKSSTEIKSTQIQNAIDKHALLHKELALFNNSGTDERRAGFDITSSAVKDLSLMMEYAHENNYELWEQLNNIHYLANMEMMKEFTNYVEARLNRDEFGNRKKISAQPVWSTFNHSVTREIDNQINPQIHTHNFVYNMCQIKDDETGKIWSLQLDKFYGKDVQHYLGSIYQNSVAAQLVKMGFELEITDKYGNFRIMGLNPEKVAEFSATSKMINSHLENYRLKYPTKSDAELKDMINDEFKKNKKKLDRQELYKKNNERLDNIELTKEITTLLNSISSKKLEKNEELILEYLKKAHKSITLTESTFTQETLLKETLRQCVHLGITAADIKSVMHLDNDLIRLADNVYSTKEVRQKEYEIIQALKLKNFVIDSDTKKIEKYLKEKNIKLSPGQTRALKMVHTRPEQFQLIQGDAGSGKTFSMKVLADVYGKDFDIYGFAPTAIAAIGLGQMAGIQAQTIDKYLIKPFAPEQKKRLFLVDETSMVDSLKMHAFIEQAKLFGDKVVFIGDTKQLQSVGAGRIFADMQRFGGLTSYVTENMRQESIFDKKMVDLMKNKNAEEVLKRLNSNIFEAEKKDLIDSIVRDYEKGDLVIAQKNIERHELNQKIRTKLGKEGAVAKTLVNINATDVSRFFNSTYPVGTFIETNGIPGLKYGQKVTLVRHEGDDEIVVKTHGNKPRELTIKLDLNTIDKLQFFEEKEIMLDKGERIIFTKNLDIKGVAKIQNSGTAVVKEFKNGFLTFTTDGGRDATVHIDKLPYIDYGYAVTDFKSQGMTVKNVKVLIDEGMTTFNSFYTQLTRFKSKIQAYTTNKAELAELILREAQKTTTLDYVKGLKNEENTFTDTSRQILHKLDNIEPTRQLPTADREHMRTLRECAMVHDVRGVEMLLQVNELDRLERRDEIAANNIVRYSNAPSTKFQSETRAEIEKNSATTRARIKEFEMENIQQIKQELHPSMVIALAEEDVNKYKVSRSKDGKEYRINIDNKNYSVSDFLTKHLKMEWTKAKEILETAWKFHTIDSKIAQKMEEIKRVPKQQTLFKPDTIDYKSKIEEAKSKSFDTILGSEWVLDKAHNSTNWGAFENTQTGRKIRFTRKKVDDKDVYFYFNPENENDRGTIIDLLNFEGKKSYKDMYDYISKSEPKQRLKKELGYGGTVDMQKVESVWESANAIINKSNYLTHYRNLKEETYLSYDLRTDKRGNIITPVYSLVDEKIKQNGVNVKYAKPFEGENGLIKDVSYGSKGLTILGSKIKKEEVTNIVVAESAIDALSYVQIANLNPKQTVLISTNGTLSADSQKLLEKLDTIFPNAQKTIATDKDQAGQKTAAQIQKIMKKAEIKLPKNKDFNEDLQSQKTKPLTKAQASKIASLVEEEEAQKTAKSVEKAGAQKSNERTR